MGCSWSVHRSVLVSGSLEGNLSTLISLSTLASSGHYGIEARHEISWWNSASRDGAPRLYPHLPSKGVPPADASGCDSLHHRLVQDRRESRRRQMALRSLSELAPPGFRSGRGTWLGAGVLMTKKGCRYHAPRHAADRQLRRASWACSPPLAVCRNARCTHQCARWWPTPDKLPASGTTRLNTGVNSTGTSHRLQPGSGVWSNGPQTAQPLAWISAAAGRACSTAPTASIRRRSPVVRCVPSGPSAPPGP